LRISHKIASSFLLLSLSFFAGCSTFDLRTAHTLRTTAGHGAIDCGVALFPTNIPRLNACAIGATVERTPFYVRYHLQRADSIIDRGLVRNASGDLFEVSSSNGPGAEHDAAQILACKTDQVIPDSTYPDLKLLTCTH
jgi:hypothetical protein